MQLPTEAQAKSVTEELRSRSAVPAYVKTVLEALPAGTHPMTQFSTLVLALQVKLAQLSEGIFIPSVLRLGPGQWC
jgi:citrate synthase